MNKLCNHIIIALLLAIIVGVPLWFDVRIYSVYDLSKITLLYLLTFTLVIVFSVKKIFCYEEFQYNNLLIPIAIYFVINCLSTIFSVNPVMSLLGTYKRYDGLISLMVYLFVFMAITNYVKMNMIDMFVNVIIISACLTCVYGICQFYGLDYFKWNTGYGGRIFSTIGHPAFYSIYLVMILPLIYYCLLKTEYRILMGAYIFAIGLFIFTFYLTKTRAAFIGLVVSNIFFFVLVGKNLIRTHKIRFAIIIGILIGITGFSNSYLIERFSRDIDMSKEGGLVDKLHASSYNRYFTILTAWEVVKDYPILGIGRDTFGLAFPYYITKVVGNHEMPTELQDRAHQGVLDILLSVGFVGLCSFIYLIYAFVRMISYTFSEHRLIKLSLSTGLLCYMVNDQFSFGHVPVLLMFWTFIGLGVVVCKDIVTPYSMQS